MHPSSTHITRTALAIALLAALVLVPGCGSNAPSQPISQGGGTGASSGASTSAPAGSYSLTFDRAASLAGHARKAPESTFSASWFPPANVTGLRQIADAAQVKALLTAATANSQFWISRPNNHEKPIVFGADATSLLTTSTGVNSAMVVPVYDVTDGAASASQLGNGAKPSSYQVILSGPVGDSSFGLRPGTAAGQWLLDPNGELLNYGNAIDSVARKVGFTAERAYVVRTAFDLQGKPALYLSWAVFRDASGKQYAVTLHSPPPIKATWTIAGTPLAISSVFDIGAIYGPVTLTPTK